MTKLIATTGAAGFLGGHLRARLEGDGCRVENMPLEIRRSGEAARRWLAERRPAALVHLAGIVDVRRCHQHPVEAFQAHVMETGHLLEAVRQERPDMPVVYVATDKSFGEQEDCGLETPYRPIFPYDASKACEDILVESYRATYGLPIRLLRFPNFYGEGDAHAERLVPSVCLAAVTGGELVIRTRLDGSYRQYIYVKDAADIVGLTLAQMSAGAGSPENSHFGPPDIKSVGDVIRDVEAIAGKALKVVALNQPSESSRISLRDQNRLGYAYTDWRVGLRRTFEFYQRGGQAPAP
jgi:CDP-glucose 4,6-dehydratase